jgi:hypothetical protein
MPRPRILTWNGKDVPAELRDLPVGALVLQQGEELRALRNRLNGNGETP